MAYQGTHRSSGGDVQELWVLGHLEDGCSPIRGQHRSAQSCAALRLGSELEGASAERATCTHWHLGWLPAPWGHHNSLWY